MEYVNHYKCPQILWKGFSIGQRATYNYVYAISYKNQHLINFSGVKLSDKEWRVICHNFSVEAALAFKSINARIVTYEAA